jgi:hypothetical protein
MHFMPRDIQAKRAGCLTLLCLTRSFGGRVRNIGGAACKLAGAPASRGSIGICTAHLAFGFFHSFCFGGFPDSTSRFLKREAAVLRSENFVPILYQNPAFDAFDDFCNLLESTSCETSESCQVRGSNPCRGASLFSITYETPARILYEWNELEEPLKL